MSDYKTTQRGRPVLLVATGLVLLALLLTGVIGGLSDTDVNKAQAFTIAEEQLDFEPEDRGARLVRQGFSMRPVWAISFSIPDPEGGTSDFLRHMTVEVDARSGKVLRVGDDGGGA